MFRSLCMKKEVCATFGMFERSRMEVLSGTLLLLHERRGENVSYCMLEVG